MNLAGLTEQIRTLIENENNLKAKVKFKTDEGVVFADTTVTPFVLNNEDADADCTIEVSLENLGKLMSKDLNPMTAMLLGKLKVKGDMGIAMKIAQAFAS